MSDILLNDSNEFVWVNGDLVMATGIDAIRQHLIIRLRFFLGEWFQNRDEGIDYYGKILVKNPDIPLITGILNRVVRETPGVVSVDVFDLTYVPSTRSLRLSFSATCDEDVPLVFTDFVLVDSGVLVTA